MQISLWDFARICRTEQLRYRLLHARFGDLNLRIKRAFVARRQHHSLNRGSAAIGADEKQLDVMEGRTKVEKSVSSDHEVIRDWRHRFTFLGSRGGREDKKQGEGDHSWAHVQILVEKIAPTQGVASRSLPARIQRQVLINALTGH